MLDTFWSADAFNSELAWDTSKVTNMQLTFHDADAFNSELAWDTSKVTNMYSTFVDAEAFNQPLDWGYERGDDDAADVTAPKPSSR